MKPEKRFLAYCIERPLAWEGKELLFVLRVGTHLKDGGVKISESRSQADLSNPPKYLVNEDFLVASMFHQRAGKRNYYEDLALTGGGWEEFLEAAHATGRLFWGEEIESGKPAKKYVPITFGPPQAVNAVWRVQPSGSAKPELECENPGVIVIPTQPPRYLDPATGALGIAVSDLPAAVLGAWQNGPAVSAKDLAVISERFSAISTTALPVPAKVETERREPTPPLPHLRVYARTIGKSWEQHVFIVGQISFRYEDSRLLPPLAKGHPQSHAEVREGRRVFWPRDFEAEQAHIARLKKAGLMSLSGVISVTLLDTAALHSVVPVDPGFSQQLTWLELLGKR